jgi:hypothetical protein
VSYESQEESAVDERALPTLPGQTSSSDKRPEDLLGGTDQGELSEGAPVS